MKNKLEEQILKISKTILELAGFEAGVKVEDSKDQVKVEITSEKAGLLIGKQGQNLQALERILQVLLYSALGKDKVLKVDVGGFREKREEFISDLAQKKIEEVLVSKNPATLSGLTPAERKVIHLKVAKFDKLTSESQGTGLSRVLNIKPRK